MRTNNLNQTTDTSNTLVQLHAQHQKFHQFLDRLAAKSNDLNVIDLLIGVRKVNMDCISKYTGLLAKQDYSPSKTNKTLSYSVSQLREDDMTLWNIHGQLVRFQPLYQAALSNKDLSKVSRMIIAQNYEQLIALKEQLLHPIPVPAVA